MDDIVFGSTSKHLVEHFVRHMSIKFEMSLVGVDKVLVSKFRLGQ